MDPSKIRPSLEKSLVCDSCWFTAETKKEWTRHRKSMPHKILAEKKGEIGAKKMRELREEIVEYFASEFSGEESGSFANFFFQPKNMNPAELFSWMDRTSRKMGVFWSSNKLRWRAHKYPMPKITAFLFFFDLSLRVHEFFKDANLDGLARLFLKRCKYANLEDEIQYKNAEEFVMFIRKRKLLEHAKEECESYLCVQKEDLKFKNSLFVFDERILEIVSSFIYPQKDKVDPKVLAIYCLEEIIHKLRKYKVGRETREVNTVIVKLLEVAKNIELSFCGQDRLSDISAKIMGCISEKEACKWRMYFS